MHETKPLQSVSIIARQAIVDAQRAVVAYELFDRSTQGKAHDTGSDLSLLFNAMADTSNALGVRSKLLFINRTHASLADGQLDMATPEKFVVELAPVPGHDAAQIKSLAVTLDELRKSGFRIAFNHTVVAPAYKAWWPLADYVKVDTQAVQADMLKPLVAAARVRTKAKLVAEKVETQDQFGSMATLGFDLFQGYWIDRPQVVKTRVVAPSHASVLILFNLVRKPAEIEEIEDLLKHDAMLGFNLLKLINSAAFGLGKEVTSFRHAVMLIGMKRLFRWAALLLTASREGGASAIVGTTAIVRGRMMELLCQGRLSADDVESAFVTGVFSLLDEMLGVPMEDALRLISLPTAVTQALLTGDGTLGRMLALVRAAEISDDLAFANIATELGYDNHTINMAHLDALVWADAVVLG
ncbi:HDOD domain-containing protein [Curvibacter sp. APW13]|uniref:EAL and HDOD domain-containing protein n=1 Tax=Curvibacter sp. APW13 TaxID=3077236 RepID=UPI0028DF4387|nr:HDOD domain-containing protein [Curvibacter sp. APW13]MDT8992144.1 HDOD domain-containing protein [Curvibacter sp. APW13]